MLRAKIGTIDCGLDWRGYFGGGSKYGFWREIIIGKKGVCGVNGGNF